MRRHETDAVSLVPALVFLGLAGWWALDRLTTVDLPLAWLTALTLLVAGAVGLVVTLTRGRKAPGGTSGTPMGSGTDDSTDPAHDHGDDDLVADPGGAPRDSTTPDTATPDTATPVSIRTDAAGDGGPEPAAGTPTASTPTGDATTGDLPR